MREASREVRPGIPLAEHASEDAFKLSNKRFAANKEEPRVWKTKYVSLEFSHPRNPNVIPIVRI